MPAVYDFAALAEVADEVRVMAYDQHAYEYGPGPVAGWEWVEAVTTFALSEVPAERLRLGVPTYARDFARGGHVSLSGNEARALARRQGARIRWSAEHRESWFVYRSGGVRHEVWFSSPRAVALRARLADRLGLLGSSLWAAGLGAAGTWSALGNR
jgi:spore germination protein YaaH